VAQTRFSCTLTNADEPACLSYAGVTIVDAAHHGTRLSPPRRRRTQLHHRRTRRLGPLEGPQRIVAQGS
jgi:hypothetical protein